MQMFVGHDYDQVDNDLDRAINAQATRQDYQRVETWRWILSVLVGLIMGCIAYVVNTSTEAAGSLRLATVHAFIGPGRFWLPLAVLLIITAAYAAVAGFLVSFVEPLAAGSGIPEMKTYLNGIDLKGFLAWKALIAKAVGIVFSISAGIVAGKEGPFVHGGAIVGGGVAGMGSHAVARLFRTSGKLPRWLGGHFRDDGEHRDFVAIGTAAGVATAFLSPIGGLLFTIEEALSFYSASIFWRGFLATCTGVLTIHTLQQLGAPNGIMWARYGVTRDFGLYPDTFAFYGSVFYFHIWELPVFALMGACGALSGALFIYLNVRLTRWRQTRLPVEARWARLAEVCAVACVTAALMFVLSYWSPCRPVTDPAGGVGGAADDAGRPSGRNEQYFPQMWCPAGEYSVLGQVLFVPLAQSLRIIIHLGEPAVYNFDAAALAVHHVVLYALMVWTYGVGAPSGLFVPSLAVGASAGRLVGQLLERCLHLTGSVRQLSLPAYAVVGAAASLGGATRMTLSIAVLVMETTGSLQLIVPLMVTVFVAKNVGDRFGHGIYDSHIRLRGSPVLEEPNSSFGHKYGADTLTVADVSIKRLHALPPVARVSSIVSVIVHTRHGAFPVTPDPGGAWHGGGFDLHGVITRQMLYKLLKHRVAFWGEANAPVDPAANIPPSKQGCLALQTLLQHRPVKIASADVPDLIRGLSPAEMRMVVDLRPFMQRHPYTVAADAPLSRAYRLFRTMGLRHLFVAPPQPRIVGVLTRKDITEQVVSVRLRSKRAPGRQAAAGDVMFGGAGERYTPFIPHTEYNSTIHDQDQIQEGLFGNAQRARAGRAGHQTRL